MCGIPQAFSLATLEDPIFASVAPGVPLRACTAGGSAKLRLSSPVEAHDVPLTTGVCFPKGAVHDTTALHLKDERGYRRALQAAPLARWADGSIKWLLIDTIAPEISAGDVDWSLLWSGPDDSSSGDSVPDDISSLQNITEEIQLETVDGEVRLVRVADDSGANVRLETSLGFLWHDRIGRTRRPRIERSTWESAGPVRQTLLLEGRFPQSRGLRFTARICVFGTAGLIRLAITLHNPNRAQHRGGKWDLGDPGSILFQGFDVDVRLPEGTAPHRMLWQTETDAPLRSTSFGRHVEIYQDSSGGENWNSRNHINRDGRVPCRFRGYRVRCHALDRPTGHAESRHSGAERPQQVNQSTTAPIATSAQEDHGWRANPLLAIQNDVATLAVAVPEFWQQFPKSLSCNGRTIRVGLFPRQWNDTFELQGGESKTHTIWIQLSTENALPAWVHAPIHLAPEPSAFAAAGVFPWFAGTAGDSARQDAYLSEIVDGPRSLVARREVIDEYGWRNYGDVWADHEQAYYPGPFPVISHYNNQFDLLNGAILQFARTGDVRWWNILDPLARHVVDIDLYRTDQDRACYNGGLFWHTDHYVDAATSTHRTYSKAQQRAGISGGGGPSCEHNYTTGLAHHYYLTGNPRSRDAVVQLADWVIAMEDGARTVFGIVDAGPTGLGTATCAQDYHGPGRGAGNSLNALVDAWQLTGNRHYLDFAETLIRRVVHPSDDIDARQLLHVEARWSYTVFLVALAKFLESKLEAGENDLMYAWGRAALLHYAEWMAAHERPYFDRPDELEYPTETWAAQELRKANVLRLAAAFAEEPLRSRIRQRGDELADRAWDDLQRFESKHVARAAAILMTEATRDAFFSGSRFAVAPRPAEHPDFGSPERFVPQKHRVVRRARSASGALQQIVRLANPVSWPRLFHNVVRYL